MSTPTKKDNLNWIKDVNVRTAELQEENIEERLLDTDLGSDFTDMTATARP